MRTVRAGVALLLTGTITLGAAGCSGGDSGGAAERSPQQVLAAARKTFDATSGVELTLATKNLPSGVNGLVSATGTATHAPAFEGQIVVRYSGLEPKVPVVAVGGKVYAQVPFTTGWSTIDPGDYGAPDPVRLITPGQGFSALLAGATGLTKGDQVRGGADFKEVLTTYEGTEGAEQVAEVIPSAKGDFDATFQVTSDDELRTVVLTGDFYGTGDTETYTITLDQYGTKKSISAPSGT